MNLKKSAVILFLAAGLLIIAYILPVDEEESFFAFKIGFIYAVAALGFMLWLVSSVFKNIFSVVSEISRKYKNIEALLLDLRSGTKTFYKEKRRFPRIEHEMVVKIIGDTSRDGFAVTRNISENGALLLSSEELRAGDAVDINIYLPLFPQPVDIRARIVRVEAEGGKKTGNFAGGIEFYDMHRSDRGKLLETIEAIKNNRLR